MISLLVCKEIRCLYSVPGTGIEHVLTYKANRILSAFYSVNSLFFWYFRCNMKQIITFFNISSLSSSLTFCSGWSQYFEVLITIPWIYFVKTSKYNSSLSPFWSTKTNKYFPGSGLIAIWCNQDVQPNDLFNFVHRDEFVCHFFMCNVQHKKKNHGF